MVVDFTFFSLKMDIKEIDSFFDYQLTFEEEPVALVEEIVRQASEYLPESIKKLEFIGYFKKK